MEFTTSYKSVSFEYLYGGYTISIADYLQGDGTPDGRITILIQRLGESLSTKSVERIADYISQRLENGIAMACNHIIDINIDRNEQFMYHLHNALNILFP
jgi:formylmethanofuran:tetrahydromethanopterin formyltransferase